MAETAGYRRSNPFRAANVRPGANAFVFADAAIWPQLLVQLQRHRFCEIVGPHGSGKSTLFHQLVDTCESWGWCVHRHVLDSRQPARPRLRLEAALASPAAPTERLRAVDGYEQLTTWQRRSVRQHCQKHGERLLVTSHAGQGLHVLLRTHVDLSLARHVIQRILDREGTTWTVSDAQLEQLLTTHQENLREVLFALYDVFAQAAALQHDILK